ncbi:MAG: AAA family ATPase [Hyphomicrobiaceae bacterium]
MKVRAIRVAEFARFSEPVALEGLTGGLDLVLGPNEAGKSTLFKALHLALFEKHSSRKAELSSIQPYGGGAPLVEVEFKAANETWRLKKRFLSERSAELVSLTTGNLARGSEAEDALEQLLDLKASAGRFPMLWLAQGELLDKAEIKPESEAVVRSAIDREVAAVAGGGTARRVRQRVKAALDELVTAQRGQRRGRFLEATRAAERVANDLGLARAAFSEAETLLTRLAALGAVLDKNTQPGEVEALRQNLSEAEIRLKEAQNEIATRDAARVALADARTTQHAASLAERALDEGLAEMERLEIAARQEAIEKSALHERLSAVDAELGEATEALAASRRGLEVAEDVMKRAAAVARLKDLSARVIRARAATERISALQDALHGSPLDEAVVRDARKLASRIAEGAARLEAASTAVTVKYAPKSEQRIVVDGRVVADGERVVATVPLVLEVAGLGRIEIVPGASKDRDQLESALAADRRTLGRIVTALGVEDVQTLEARHESARSIASEIEAARAEVSGIAPEGVESLEIQLQAVADHIGPDPGSNDAVDVEAVTREIDQHRERLQALEAACRAAASSRETLRQQIAVLTTRSEERERRRHDLGASLPVPELRSQRRMETVMAAEAANRALDETLRLHAIAASRAVDQDGMAQLEQSVAEAREASRRNDQAIAALNAERARIEGALEAARREDIGSRVALLEVEADRAQARLDDIAEEVQALQLLDQELAAEEDRLRESYLAPVIGRLGPFIEMVFPDAALTLGRGYAVDSLSRGARAEELKRLSDGTREQIAVLVRLAFGRLLADQGAGVPLVLDDALVYSDDQRIAAMHRALEAAAQAHQVIVLSCREQSFAGLDGNRVALVPWRQARS